MLLRFRASGASAGGDGGMGPLQMMPVTQLNFRMAPCVTCDPLVLLLFHLLWCNRLSEFALASLGGPFYDAW